MARNKISPILSKLLNDVEANSLVVSDEEIVKIDSELSQATEEVQEDTVNAEMLSEAIEELNVAKNDVEAGLQSGIDHVSAKLLATRLKNAMTKLDSGNTIVISGMQSDNYNTTLQAGLLAADGILKKAVDMLKALWKKIVAGIVFIWDSIKKFFAWIFGSSKKAEEDLKKTEEIIDEASNIVDNVADLSTEIKEDIARNIKEKKQDPFTVVFTENSGAPSSKEYKEFKDQLAKASSPSKILAEAIVASETEELTRQNLEKAKAETIKNIKARYFRNKATDILKQIINAAAIDASLYTSDKVDFGPYFIADKTTGYIDDGSVRRLNIKAMEKPIVDNFIECMYKIANPLSRGLVESMGGKDRTVNYDKSEYLTKNIYSKLENIESYVSQIENVLNKKEDFNYSILKKNIKDSSFLIFSTFSNIVANGNTKDYHVFNISFSSLIGSGFSGGASYDFKVGLENSILRNIVTDLTFDWADKSEYGSDVEEEIRKISRDLVIYNGKLNASRKELDIISDKQKNVTAQMNKIISIFEKGGVVTGEKEGTSYQHLFLSGIQEIVYNLNNLSIAAVTYTKAMSMPVSIAKIMVDAFAGDNLEREVKKVYDSKYK